MYPNPTKPIAKHDPLRPIALFVLMCLLVSSCQSASGPATSSGTATEEPSETASSSQTEPSASVQPSLTNPEIVVGPGSFDLLDPRTGLADLSSYQQKLVVSFDGTKDGQPRQWSMTYTFLHTQVPPASLLTIESSGDVVAADPAILAESAGALYQSYRDGSCSGEPIDAGTSVLAQREPAGLLPGLFGAEEAGMEPANSVDAVHYTFDERAMAESGRAETDGELWVAVEGGHLLKYVRATTHDAAYFGDGSEGTINWAYDLTDIDQATEIILPTGCQIDAPSMPDATNLQVLPTWMGFDSPSTVTDLTAFYRQQMPGRGWTPSGDPLVADGTQVSVYSKGDQLLNVIVIAGETATRVDILMNVAAD